MRKVGFSLIGIFLYIAAAAQDVHPEAAPTAAKKPAWQWSLEERIARRIDPVSIRERAEASKKNGITTEELSAAGVFPAPARFVIEGRRNPELLMPFELFGSLLGGVEAESSRRSMMRRVYREPIREAGWDEELFWRVLEETSAEYRKVEHEKVGLQVRVSTLSPAERRSLADEAEALEVPVCRLRAEALEAARQKLGPEKFDRFLYEKVAPNVGMSSDFPFGNEEWRLRYLAGGCR